MGLSKSDVSTSGHLARQLSACRMNFSHLWRDFDGLLLAIEPDERTVACDKHGTDISFRMTTIVLELSRLGNRA